MLRLYNTASRSLEAFTPITPGKVGLYTCGPTVYWDASIGNFRSFVFDDILQRTLEVEDYDVTRVMNITDVGHLTDDADEGEDKMIAGARREKKSVQDIAQMYTDYFIEDAKRLNIKLPKAPYLCKATEHIREQIALIQQLDEKGFTYRTDDGIYFDTLKFPAYGALSGQKLEEKEAGARVAINTEKRNAADFALWKFSPKNEKRLMEWESPWGVGFPGWHVECSAMSRAYLGQPFDIHTGGVDHIPVHHENEIAQSEAAYGIKLAQYWLHNEFLLVDGQKMSKSLGNVYTVRDIENHGFEPLALRYLFLGTQYRQKQNFTWEALQGAQNALNRLWSAARALERPQTGNMEFEAEFLSAMEDDLNTPKALAVVWKLIDSDIQSQTKAKTLLWMDQILGLSLDKVVAHPFEIPKDIQTLVQLRNDARAKKDWLESDRLRVEILSRGWIVEDTSQGAKVHKGILSAKNEKENGKKT